MTARKRITQRDMDRLRSAAREITGRTRLPVDLERTHKLYPYGTPGEIQIRRLLTALKHATTPTQERSPA